VRRILFIVTLGVWAGGLAFGDKVAATNLSDQVRDILGSRIEEAGILPRVLCGGALIWVSPLLPPFYERRSFLPAWNGDDGPRPEVDAFLRALQEADQEGLRAEDYNLSTIESLLAELRQNMALKNPLPPEKIADLDLLVTDAFLIYASHLLTGRVNPETIQAEWYAQSRKANLDRILQIALDSQQIENVLQGLLPRHPGYAWLRQALLDYRNIAQKGGWPRLPSGPNMRKGDSGRRVRILRARLISTGDLHRAQGKSNPLFDDPLDRAVRKFQYRHGLYIDGIVGPATLAALNVPVEKRIRQIEGNLERWRWLPQDFGSRYILVNIANFDLQIIETGRPVLTMRAIVGKPYQRTPVFSALMTSLVLRPFWNVPPSIAQEEMLPLILKDQNYLAKNRIKLIKGWGDEQEEIDPATLDWSKVSTDSFPYNLRQEPGPMNPLGRIKFMFPNKFNVYLHDTPFPELFKKTTREFSHGCIRIEKPIELAEYLLRADPRWTGGSLIEEIDKSIDQTVRLPEPIPVHGLYWTAWVEEDGTVQFRKDIYDRDKPLEEVLKAKPPTPEIAGFDLWERH